MFSLVWGVITLPFTIVGFVFKLAILAVIVGIAIGGYFLGEFIGWDVILNFLKQVSYNKKDGS